MSKDTKHSDEQIKAATSDQTTDSPSDQQRRMFLKAAGVSGLASAGLGLSSVDAQAVETNTAALPADGPMKVKQHLGLAETRGQWPNSTHYSWSEVPSEDPSRLEVWGYTDATSYTPGGTLNLHVSTTAASFDLTISRDGAEEKVVFTEQGLTGQYHTTAADAFLTGAQWPVAKRITIPKDWRSGGYIVTLKIVGGDGTVIEQEAFFILRPRRADRKAIAFVAATSTWQAYNDWGGANFYEGLGPSAGGATGDERFGPTHAVSTLRPWARGQIRMPSGAPRVPYNHEVPMGAAPRYENLEWAYARGYSKYGAAAGWASFDSLFARWAEGNGYLLHYFAQDDLDRDQDLLKGYKTVVMVGHDEYHSLGERKCIDSFVKGGGHLARFGGNQIWQIRREKDSMVCYKTSAATKDPVRNDPARKHLLTSIWEVKGTDWPGAQTWGANGVRGVYGKLGGFSPRSSGGFTVYRPKHWALVGTDLYYGDVLGAKANIAAYEGDGVTYTFRNGQPYPTGEDGTPMHVEIIAMAVAGTEEEDHGNPGTYLYAQDGDMHFMAQSIYGESNEETQAKFRYGSSMVVNMKKGDGEVFNAATTEWVNGLKQRDPFVEKITRNVLDKFQA